MSQFLGGEREERGCSTVFSACELHMIIPEATGRLSRRHSGVVGALLSSMDSERDREPVIEASEPTTGPDEGLRLVVLEAANGSRSLMLAQCTAGLKQAVMVVHLEQAGPNSVAIVRLVTEVLPVRPAYGASSWHALCT